MLCSRTSNVRRVVGWGFLAVLLGLSQFNASLAQEDTSVHKLRWVNGDELTGRLIGATASHLIWQSEVLAQDISIDLRTLAWVQVEAPHAASELNAPFMVSLVNGDIVAGELQALSDEQVVLNSERHGSLKLDLGWVDRIIRTDHAAPIDLTATRGRGWQSVDPQWRERDADRYSWTFDEPGQVSTASPGVRLFYSARLPEFCDIELVIESSKRPSFSLAIGKLEKLKARAENLEFETWGDELIAQAESASAEFTPLKRLLPETRSVHLRAFWDRQSGKLTIYDRNGDVLADVTLDPTAEDLDGGVLLENKGIDLTVKLLRISPWSGVRPVVVPAAEIAKTGRQQRIRLTDGKEYVGRVTGPDDDGQLVMTPTEGEAVRIDPQQLAEVLTARSEVKQPQQNELELRYVDGTVIHGTLLGIEDGQARLTVACSPEPIHADLDGLRTLSFAAVPHGEVPASEHVLEYQGLSLRGTLAPAATKLGWRIVGAEEVIPLQLDRPLRIRRVKEATEVDRSANDHPGVVYLTNGDQLPCRLESVDENFVTLATEFSPLTRIPAAQVKAVEFGAAHPDEIVGFTHEGWNIANNRVKATVRSDEEIVFLGDASIAHANLLASGYCEFAATWPEEPTAYLMLTLQQSAARDIDPNARQLGDMSQQCMAYIMHSNDRLMAHIRTGVAGHQADIEPNADEKNVVHVRVQQIGDELKLFVNNQDAGTLANIEESIRWSGLTINVQQVNRGNQGKDNGDREPLVTVSHMRAGRVAGLFATTHIGETSRKYAITVPRSSRNHPPRHLLISHTGDLLRGELLELNASSVHFRSRFDELTIPLERLSGIVWLAERETVEFETPNAGEVMADSDNAGTPTLSPTGQVQAVFPNGITLHLDVKEVEGNELVGTHDIFGECRLSLDQINELQTGAIRERSQEVAFSDWMLIPAREPAIPDPNAADSFGTFSTLIGEQAEDFTLDLLDGESFQLSDHQGKVVVLDFWATWCGPCIGSIPDLLEATSAYPSDKVLFVGVNHQESATLVQSVLNDHGWAFTVALDREGEISRKYLVEGFPQTVVIGRDGRIAHVRLGASPDLQAELSEIIDKLLSDTDASSP